jgi:hypothetical protein
MSTAQETAPAEAERLAGKRQTGPEQAQASLVIGHFTDARGTFFRVSHDQPADIPALSALARRTPGRSSRVTSAARSPVLRPVAVGVGRGVAALQPDLVSAQAAEVTPVREELLVDAQPATCGWVGVDLGEPGAHAVRVELVVP